MHRTPYKKIMSQEELASFKEQMENTFGPPFVEKSNGKMTKSWKIGCKSRSKYFPTYDVMGVAFRDKEDILMFKLVFSE